MGTPTFAVPTLQMLLASKCKVLAVVSQPDRPIGRKRVLQAPPVKQLAIQHAIPVLQPERLRKSAAEQELINLKPDLIVTAAYGQILSNELLAAPRYGAVNVHASLLPKYRGGAPIQHALINEELRTGITLLYMVEALDAGNIIVQQELEILPEDDSGSLHLKLSQLGAQMLNDLLPKLGDPNLESQPQIETLVTYAPNIKRADEKICWDDRPGRICGLVRALSPHPGAYTTWRGKVLKIWQASSIIYSHGKKTGEILKADLVDGLWVAAQNGVVQVTQLQLSGKTRMDVDVFIRGNNIKVGEQLGS
ncbi:MAG: methionyl-tRNA formyltransferase [Bacillota bacterium]